MGRMSSSCATRPDKKSGMKRGGDRQKSQHDQSREEKRDAREEWSWKSYTPDVEPPGRETDSESKGRDCEDRPVLECTGGDRGSTRDLFLRPCEHGVFDLTRRSWITPETGLCHGTPLDPHRESDPHREQA